jgi:hypothetical protein
MGLAAFMASNQKGFIWRRFYATLG